MENYNTVRCTNCKFYQVTWDAYKPYGCVKLGFKTTILPSTYVTQISGKECQSFIKKKKRI